MIKMNKYFIKIILIFLFIYPAKLESAILSIGNQDAKVVVKVFSSLTCPHCASFHKKIYGNLKREFIDKGQVRFEHHAFPLDLAALNAEIIIRCHVDNEKKFELLEKIYDKQNIWAVGSDIDKINESIKEIGLKFNLSSEKMNKCLEDENAQDDILNQRINAQKEYKIESTPTIIINEKKFSGKFDYQTFKKVIEKNL
jgi:protein-disulfide isomerase